LLLPFSLFVSTNATGVCRLDLTSFPILPFNRFVHFLSVNRDILWSFNTQPDFIPAYIDNRNYDVIANHDALITMSRQN
jgi:hypothetical protein